MRLSVLYFFVRLTHVEGDLAVSQSNDADFFGRVAFFSSFFICQLLWQTAIPASFSVQQGCAPYGRRNVLVTVTFECHDDSPVVTVSQEPFRSRRPHLFLKAVRGSDKQIQNKMQPPEDTSSPRISHRRPAAWVTVLHPCCGLLSTHQRHGGARTKIYYGAGLSLSQFDLRPGAFT